MQRDGTRHFTAYTITAVLYILGALGIYFYQSEQFVSEKKPEEKRIEMSLSTFVPEPIVEKVEEVIEPEPIKEPEPIIEKPEPIVEKVIPKPLPPVVKKPMIKKKIIKKIIKPKPVKKRKTKKQKINKKMKKKRLKKTMPKKGKPSKKRVSKATKSRVSPAKKSAFFAKVRAEINRYKMYPRIAQKRAMEGTVKVKFTILANGKVSNIQVSGRKVFLNSAREAVKRAFPIPVKSIPVSLPKTVNLTLRYQLR